MNLDFSERIVSLKTERVARLLSSSSSRVTGGFSFLQTLESGGSKEEEEGDGELRHVMQDLN